MGGRDGAVAWGGAPASPQAGAIIRSVPSKGPAARSFLRGNQRLNRGEKERRLFQEYPFARRQVVGQIGDKPVVIPYRVVGRDHEGQVGYAQHPDAATLHQWGKGHDTFYNGGEGVGIAECQLKP